MGRLERKVEGIQEEEIWIVAKVLVK